METNILAAVPAAAFFCYLLLLLVMARGKKSHINKVFTLYIAVMVVWSFGAFMMRTGLPPDPLFWNRILCIGFLAMPVTFYHFSVAYEEKYEQQKYFLLFGYTAMAAFQISNWFGGIISEAYLVGTTLHYQTGPFAAVFAVIGVALFAGASYNFYNGIKIGRVEYDKVKYIFIGLIALISGSLLNLFPVIGQYPVDLLGAAINGLILSYVIFRYKFLEMNVLLNKGLVYSLLTISLTVGYFVSVFVVHSLLAQLIQVNTYVVAFVMAVIIAACFQPTKNWMQSFVDRVFFPDKLEHHKILRNFNEVVNTILDVNTLSGEITRTIGSGLGVKKVGLFIFEEKEHEFQLWSLVGETESLSKRNELYFDAESPLVKELQKRDILYKNEIENEYAFKAMWEKEKDFIEELQTQMILPIRFMNKLVGIITLSRKVDNDIYSQEEMNLLTALTGSMGMALENAISYSKVRKEALTDGLTGIYNHRYLQEYLTNELAAAAKAGRHVSILMIDVDLFKLFNDLYGHYAGDRALQHLANMMLEKVRNNHVIARYGGEEFTAVLSGVSREEAFEVAEEMRKGVEKDFYRLHGRVLTISIGLASFPQDGGDRETLINAADNALYFAKSRGRNRIVAYYPEMQRDSSGDTELSLETAYISTMYALTAAIDVKDHYTFGHSKNVGNYGYALALSFGLSENQARNIYYAGLLHDIGKIGVPERILNKPGTLNNDEMDSMKQHVELSVSIVKHISTFLPLVPIVYCHHERYDGKGYPRALEGKHIPLEARILSVVDAFDAMTTERPYRQALSPEKALDELLKGAGKQFDPEVVAEFCKLVRKGVLADKTGF